MTRRGWLIGFACLIPLALLLSWWYQTYELAYQKLPAPPRGEARYNPLFALKKALQIRGVKVASRANLDIAKMSPMFNDTIVLAADVRTLSSAQAESLLDWVDSGGHLVFELPRGKPGRAGALLDALGLSVTGRMICLTFPVAGQTQPARDCFSARFKIDAGEQHGERGDVFTLLAGDADKGYFFGRKRHGDGAWFLASDLDFLRNQELGEPGNAALAWQVLAPALKGGTVHLVYATDVPPLHVLLVDYGWPALVPALLALLAWLWARSQRLGPALALADPNRRALYEHVAAAGEFAYRRGRAAALYAPLRRAFMERLRRDHPALAALDDNALAGALAEKTGRSPDEVRLALMPIDLTRPEHFQATMKILSELRTMT